MKLLFQRRALQQIDRALSHIDCFVGDDEIMVEQFHHAAHKPWSGVDTS